MPRSALWTVADQLADECRASPEGGVNGARISRAADTRTPAPADSLGCVSLRLQGHTSGALGLTAWTRPAAQARATEERVKRRGTGHERLRVPGSRRCGAAPSLASFGRRPYGRGGCRARPPRHRPQPVPAVTSPIPRSASWSQPSASRQVRIAGRRVTSTGPKRRALSGSAPPPSRA